MFVLLPELLLELVNSITWHTSAYAEAGLLSSYKALTVGGVIQYDSDE